MNGNEKWKDFEVLVAAIEAAAAPIGAKVSQDDRLPDKITGEMRQVDVTVRLRAGLTEILIIIECRDRNRTEDVRWVEEAVTKTQGLAASKLILVSATGFSEAAKLKARHYGAELRVLSEVNANAMHDWFLPNGIAHLFRTVENFRCVVTLAGNPAQSQSIDSFAPVFKHKLVQTPFFPIAFVNFLSMTDPGQFWTPPTIGDKAIFSFELNGADPGLIPVPLGVPKPEKAELRCLVDNQEKEVTKLQVSFEIRFDAAIVSLDQGKHHVYDSGGGAKIMRSEFEGNAFGLPIRLLHQSSAGPNESSVVFPSGLTMPSTWIPLPRDPQLSMGAPPIVVERQGSALCSCPFLSSSRGGELSRFHAGGLRLLLKAQGKWKKGITRFACLLKFERVNVGPCFTYTDLVAFLKACELGDQLRFGTSPDAVVPVNTWGGLQSIGRIVRKVEAIYGELDLQPVGTLAEFADGAFADSYGLLDKLVESKNGRLKNPLPPLEGVHNERGVWKKATIYCSMLIPLPEGKLLFVVDFDGEVRIPESNPDTGMSGCRFTSVSQIRRQPPEGIPHELTSINNPFVALSTTAGWEICDGQLKRVDRPTAGLGLKASIKPK